MIIFTITQFITEYSDYDSCGCGRVVDRDIEMFTTVEKALAKLKEIRETQTNSQFRHDKDSWYDIKVKEIE